MLIKTPSPEWKRPEQDVIFLSWKYTRVWGLRIFIYVDWQDRE